MNLLIVGASARAAAMSAQRAGYRVVAGDLFADADLCAAASSAVVIDYPEAIPDFVADSDADGWLYTGALENRPDLIARAARYRPLLGNSASVVRQARDPFMIRSLLADHGLPVPDVARDESSLSSAYDWLCKPLHSAGGARVEDWRCEGAPSTTATAALRVAAASSAIDRPNAVERWRQWPRDWYFQQRIQGRPFSASFLAANRKSRLVGTAWQLIGQGWTGASGYRYCGSIAWNAPPSVTTQCERLAQIVTAEFGLTGLFGIDAILEQRDSGSVVWPIEINPRYAASMELFERHSLPAPDHRAITPTTQPRSLIDAHVAACAAGQLSDAAPRASTKLSGKAILFATRKTTVDARAAATLADWNRDQWSPIVADLPRGETHFSAGWPMVTLFADGDDESEVLTRMKQLSANARRVIGGHDSPSCDC